VTSPPPVEQLGSEQLEANLLTDAWHFGSRAYSRRKKWASNDCAVQGPGREARNETSNFRITRPSGQKPDALALMGCAGGWIVMPETTELSVSMIVSLSASLPHCRLSDLTDSLSALSI
jgi:hypothetical protein